MAIQEYNQTTTHRSDRDKIFIAYFEDSEGFKYDPSSKIKHKIQKGGELTFYYQDQGERVELKAYYSIM